MGHVLNEENTTTHIAVDKDRRCEGTIEAEMGVPSPRPDATAGKRVKSGVSEDKTAQDPLRDGQNGPSRFSQAVI
ncbi:hypothetical protein GCM10009069_16510 [Algimonas arctica]|uniref:Uncharacterized protein n=1 Tax=Algimonas arctica TaxID=1479486 RepID=A0A8J3CRB3_9PROT|nr:hypothetical protein [Algimonas arctica]GHA94078.1 hypothetical protein GCM10009069_16510 [Algimonas arctica]